MQGETHCRTAYSVHYATACTQMRRLSYNGRLDGTYDWWRHVPATHVPPYPPPSPVSSCYNPRSFCTIWPVSEWVVSSSGEYTVRTFGDVSRTLGLNCLNTAALLAVCRITFAMLQSRMSTVRILIQYPWSLCVYNFRPIAGISVPVFYPDTLGLQKQEGIGELRCRHFWSENISFVLDLWV